MTADELEARFVAWAGTREDVTAGAVLGSRARRERPADAWSDLDLLVLATSPDELLDDPGWLDELGTPRITFVEPTATGHGRERRVLFDGGLDADFSIVAPGEVARLAAAPAEDVVDVVRRGVRILFDDGTLAALVRAAGSGPRRSSVPAAGELDELAHDFWYHAVWAARKLRRGELFVAKACVDGYMKSRLVTALEWHARARRPGTDTWHRGRFLEDWADPRAVAALGTAYARYDDEDVRRALVATAALFGWVARETAAALGHAYRGDVEAYASALAEETLRGSG